MTRYLVFPLLALFLAACALPGGRPVEDRPSEVELLMEDTAANQQTLGYLLPGGAYGSLIWEWPLGETIPRQPVHALMLVATASGRVEQLCPRWVVENHISAQEYLAWLEHTVDELSAFRMVDPKAEALRQDCLERSLKELRERDRWYWGWDKDEDW